MKKDKYSFHGGEITEVDREYIRLLQSKGKQLKKDELVRKFVNGKPLLDKCTADKLGRRELTNMMMFYHTLNKVVTSYRALVTSTDDLINIIVDTGNPTMDRLMGVEISEAVNRGLIYRGDKFTRFWSKVCEESVISGGAFGIYGKNTGYIPNIEKRMIFPDSADLDVENLSYCFRPVQLSLRELQSYLDSVGQEDEDAENIKNLIEQIKDQTKSDALISNDSYGLQENRGSVRDECKSDKNTVECYWFYEVKYEDDEPPYVSASLIARASDNPDLDTTDIAAEIVYIDKAFESLEDWITFIVVDSEIGGEGKINSLRGVAEMMYPAALKKEKLFNLLLEGDEIRALPKFILPDGMQPDDVQQLDLTRDTFFPAIQELRMNSSSNHLLTPMAMLDGIGNSFATGVGSSNAGEKLPDAKRRAQDQSVTEMARRDEMLRNLQLIAENIVYRALTVKVKPNQQGYQQIEWFREFLDERGVDYKKLAKRKHGKFIHMEVKVRKTLGATGLDEQQRIAQYYQDTIVLRPPQQRDKILYEMDLMMTGDPDRARDYSGLNPEVDNIILAQRTIAGQEWNDIQNLAVYGEDQQFQINTSDVHQDHIPQHLQDLNAKILSAQYRKVDKLDVAALYILLGHINQHLSAIGQNPDLGGEADAYRSQINQAVNALSQLLSAQESEEAQAQEGQPDKEMMEMQIKIDKLRLDERKQLYKEQVEMPELFNNRTSREQRSDRAQFFKEQAEAARLRIQDKQTNQ